MENCIFCRDYKNGDKIFETENFFIKVGVGIICPGHVMIITKKHFKCMGDMESEMLEEFLHLKEKLIEFLTKYLYKPFILENGVIMQSVFHAHTHFIPRKSELFEEVDLYKEMIDPFFEKYKDIKYDAIDNFSKILDIFRKDEQYLYFEQEGEMRIIKTINYLDKISLLKNEINYRTFFEKIGVKGVGDWRIMTEEDKKIDAVKIEKTMEIFKNFADFYNGNI